MAGLVPAIHAGQPAPVAGAWVYILTNKPNGILYVGVTTDLVQRIWQHREQQVEGFTKRYGLKRLVHVEAHADIRTAIQREKNLKHWPSTGERARQAVTFRLSDFVAKSR